MIKKILLLGICLVFVFCSAAFSEDIYVAQSAAGGDTGADCDNAHSMAWLNTSSNWGSDAGDVTAGDTVHLCGTLTSKLTIQGSGSAGLPITIKFEDGAKFSKNTWTANDVIILASGKNYIVIDGGTNGTIEATDTGSDMTYQTDSVTGVKLDGCDYSEVKNLTISLYHRTAGDADGGSAIGILVDHTSGTHSDYTSIHDNTFYWVKWAVYHPFKSGGADFKIYNNTIQYVDAPFAIGYNGTWTGYEIYGNTFTDPGVWDDAPANRHHHEFIHLLIGTQTINGLKIYNNFLGGDWGTYVTAQLYLEDGTYDNVEIYNNIFAGNCRTIYIQGATGTFHIYNNDFYNPGDSYAVDCASQTVNFKNNISYPTYNNSCTFAATATNLTTNPTWSTYPPSLAAHFQLQSSSSAINAGTDLSAYFTTDYADYTRSGTWDIGAYEFQGVDSTPPVISGILPSGAQRCDATYWPETPVSLQATTDENATCKYSTSDVAYDSMGSTFSTTGTTTHTQSLTLNCGSSYVYYIRCMDSSSNKNTTSSSASFMLDKDPPPSKAYHITLMRTDR